MTSKRERAARQRAATRHNNLKFASLPSAAAAPLQLDTHRSVLQDELMRVELEGDLLGWLRMNEARVERELCIAWPELKEHSPFKTLFGRLEADLLSWLWLEELQELSLSTSSPKLFVKTWWDIQVSHPKGLGLSSFTMQDKRDWHRAARQFEPLKVRVRELEDIIVHLRAQLVATATEKT